MKRRNLVSAIILLALSVGTLLETRKLPIGTLTSPQSGFFPLILAICLGIFSLVLLGQAIKEKPEGETISWVNPGGWKGLSLTVGALFVFAIFFEWLGYLISIFLLMTFLLGAIGNKRWWFVIMISLLSTLASYLIFGILLKAPLPEGILGI